MIVQGVTLNGITVFDSSPVTSGLMYAIDAGNTASYSGSGTSINNLANTSPGASTLANSPTFTSAGTSSYFTFNGTNQYVETPNLVTLFNSPSNLNLTLETWVYAPTDNGVIVTEDGQATLDGGWYDSQQEIVSGNLYQRIWQLSSANNGTFNRSTWNQCLFTYDGATFRSYLNSVAGPTSTGTRQPPWIYGGSSTNLYYFLMSGTGTNLGDGSYLAGRWSVFRVYNRALTAAEVTQNYNATKWRYS